MSKSNMLYLVSPKQNAEILKMIESGEISRNSGKAILDILIKHAIGLEIKNAIDAGFLTISKDGNKVLSLSSSMVERVPEEHSVGGSIPPSGAIY